MQISQIDKNFAVERKIERDDIVYYNVEQAPFRVYGVQKEDGKFRRMPEAEARQVSEGVYALHVDTAGGRVRFTTNSSYVAIHVEVWNISRSDHFPMTGQAGLDMYIRKEGKEQYVGTFRPPMELENGYESLLNLPEGKNTVTINMPAYAGVTKLYVGLEKDAYVEEAADYTYEKPVVYYGSSVTQGGCASRAGNSYENILSRWLDCNYINLGFSGSALGEVSMAEWIAKLEMQVFVMDYDYNAPNAEYLAATHEKMFQIIRRAQPQLPIILLSKPKYTYTDEDKRRLEVIRTTYEHAILAGDKNVYLITGQELMKEIEDEGTVDNVHPNDAGFYSMAKSIAPVLGKLL